MKFYENDEKDLPIVPLLKYGLFEHLCASRRRTYTDKFHPIISKWDPTNSTKAQALDVLKNLEFHLKTLHFKPEWKESQLKWRGKFSKTTEKTDIVLLLKELEANMQLTAFEKTWSTDREAWLLDVDKYLKK